MKDEDIIWEEKSIGRDDDNGDFPSYGLLTSCTGKNTVAEESSIAEELTVETSGEELGDPNHIRK